MSTSLSYYTSSASTSSLSPPSTPPRQMNKPLQQYNGNKRPLASTPSSYDSNRPARRLFYSTSTLSFSDDTLMTTPSSSQSFLLPSAPLFPPRTPVKKSTLSSSSNLKRSPATRNFNMFTMAAFAEDEVMEEANSSKSLGSGNGKVNLFSKNYFDYKSTGPSIKLDYGVENMMMNTSEFSSPELPESPISTSAYSSYSSEDEFNGAGRGSSREMGLESEESDFSPSAAAIRRAIIKNSQQYKTLRKNSTPSKSTLRSSFSSSSSIESLSASLRPRGE